MLSPQCVLESVGVLEYSPALAQHISQGKVRPDLPLEPLHWTLRLMLNTCFLVAQTILECKCVWMLMCVVSLSLSRREQALRAGGTEEVALRAAAVAGALPWCWCRTVLWRGYESTVKSAVCVKII